MTKTTPEQNKALVLKSIRHAVQQARLRCGVPLLARQIHPTQRTHPAWARWPVGSIWL